MRLDDRYVSSISKRCLIRMDQIYSDLPTSHQEFVDSIEFPRVQRRYLFNPNNRQDIERIWKEVYDSAVHNYLSPGKYGDSFKQFQFLREKVLNSVKSSGRDLEGLTLRELLLYDILRDSVKNNSVEIPLSPN